MELKLDDISLKNLLKSNLLFDSDWYLNNNKDVQDSGIDAVEHYLLYGWKEGRNPSFYFNNDFYIDCNSDVASSGMNPLVHYVLYGKNERRAIRCITNR